MERDLVRSNGWTAWIRASAWSLALLCQLVAGFHHHPDLVDHDDCQVCVVAHQAAAAPATPDLSNLLPLTAGEFLLPVFEFVPASIPHAAHAPRGPPSLA